jgi:hypothetical protein
MGLDATISDPIKSDGNLRSNLRSPIASHLSFVAGVWTTACAASFGYTDASPAALSAVVLSYTAAVQMGLV